MARHGIVLYRIVEFTLVLYSIYGPKTYSACFFTWIKLLRVRGELIPLLLLAEITYSASCETYSDRISTRLSSFRAYGTLAINALGPARGPAYINFSRGLLERFVVTIVIISTIIHASWALKSEQPRAKSNWGFRTHLPPPPPNFNVQRGVDLFFELRWSHDQH